MEFVEPITDLNQIARIKKILWDQSKRDYLFFVLGINTGIRIHDLLFLKVNDVHDGESIKEFITITDTKSNERKSFYINNIVREGLESYLTVSQLKESDYLFKSKKDNDPISRQQAYRIINKVAKEVGVAGKIGTHTLRKTFGYHAYRKGIAISILQSIFNHATPSETLRYIGISKHETTKIKVDVNL